MSSAFYIPAVVAVIATLMAVTRLNAVHGLLYFIVSLLSVAVIFFVLGAPFAAALEVIIYAGAIMVLFVFVVMMLNLGPAAARQERLWFSPGIWTGPVILTLTLFAELVYLLMLTGDKSSARVIDPKLVGGTLFSAYLVGVELASLLLLAGLAGAYHLGRHDKSRPEKGEES